MSSLIRASFAISLFARVADNWGERLFAVPWGCSDDPSLPLPLSFHALPENGTTYNPHEGLSESARNSARKDTMTDRPTKINDCFSFIVKGFCSLQNEQRMADRAWNN